MSSKIRTNEMIKSQLKSPKSTITSAASVASQRFSARIKKTAKRTPTVTISSCGGQSTEVKSKSCSRAAKNSKKQNNKRFVNGTYRLLKVLGAGSSGKVWLAEHAQSKVKYALKTIKKERV